MQVQISLSQRSNQLTVLVFNGVTYQSAFKNRIKSAVITNRKHLDYDAFMDDVKILFK